MLIRCYFFSDVSYVKLSFSEETQKKTKKHTTHNDLETKKKKMKDELTV